jgi:hypothetical protein
MNGPTGWRRGIYRSVFHGHLVDRVDGLCDRLPKVRSWL